jgi:hypothetical protein
MDQLRKNYLWVILLLFLSVPLFFLNIHHTHTAGGDDYALYIKEAENIAKGKPFYESNYVFNTYNNCYSPPQYPPGFPLLLAPIVKVWGLDIQPMCYFNTVVAVLLLLSFFFYFRKHMGAVASVFLALVITYSGYMMALKQSVLSDATALLFVMGYLIVRNSDKIGWGRIVLLILFSAMAILIRTQSVLLLFAEVFIWLYFIAKSWKDRRRLPFREVATHSSIKVVAGGFILTLLLNKVVFYTPYSAGGFYVNFLKITLEKGLLTIVRDNVNFYLESITTFFHYDTENSIRTAIVTIMESAGLVLCIIGFFLSISRRISFDDIFFLLLSGMVLYYPIHDPRYFLPAIAIVFLYNYIALNKVLPAITSVNPRYVGLAFTFIYLFAGLKYLKGTLQPPANYVPEARDRQAFEYLKTHVAQDELIVCARPRLITLYTDRKCIIHAWQHPMEENKRVFDSLQAKYLLQIPDIVNDYYTTYLNHYQHPIDSVDIAPGYRLYTLR